MDSIQRVQTTQNDSKVYEKLKALGQLYTSAKARTYQCHNMANQFEINTKI